MIRKTVAVLACVLLFACPEPKKEEITAKPPEVPVAPAAPPAPPSVVAAGEAYVGVEQFETRLKQYGPAFSTSLPNVKFLAEAMLDEEILMKEAERRGIDKEPGTAQKLADYRRQLLTQSLLEKLEPKADSITPEMVKEYFEKNPMLFKLPERIRVSRIAFAPDQKEKAKEALAKLKKGTAFAVVAKEYSRDVGSRETGGDIGIYTRGTRPDLGDGPFTLKKVGDYAIFDTPLEVNIAQLTGRFEAHEDTLEDPKVQDRIRMELRRNSQEKSRQGILKATKDNTPPKFDEKKLQGFVVAPPKPE